MLTNKFPLVWLLLCISTYPFAERPCQAIPQAEAQKETRCTSIKNMLFKNEGDKSVAYFEGKRFTGKACSYFPDGSIYTVTTYINGDKEGNYKIYFKNGVLETDGNLLNGKDHGIYRQYYGNGQLRYDYTYNNGNKTGYWRGYYIDGTRYTERYFENNELNGKVLVWDEQGKLAKEYLYRNGTLIESKQY